MLLKSSSISSYIFCMIIKCIGATLNHPPHWICVGCWIIINPINKFVSHNWMFLFAKYGLNLKFYTWLDFVVCLVYTLIRLSLSLFRSLLYGVFIIGILPWHYYSRSICSCRIWFMSYMVSMQQIHATKHIKVIYKLKRWNNLFKLKTRVNIFVYNALYFYNSIVAMMLIYVGRYIFIQVTLVL